ncbi:MAG: endonuclease domain-containing protein [Gemmatimonadetes bacterium]|nr:endonuclease domain-containing protein [Gemmatimonadota bacterium]
MAEHNLTERARELRRQSTDAERMLWSRLRDRRLRGIKFRRQAQIGQYIVDFLCMERRLIIELDGGHHADQRDSDDARTRALESDGFRVLRFWNNEVLREPDSVLEAILLHLDAPATAEPPSP